VSGVTAAPDRRLDVRVQAVDTNPTTMRAKFWAHGTPEPANWLRSATGAMSGMQQPGAVGALTYLSSSASNSPIRHIDPRSHRHRILTRRRPAGRPLFDTSDQTRNSAIIGNVGPSVAVCNTTCSTARSAR